MSAALLAFLAALLAGLGARDQVHLAHLSARRHLPPVLMAIAAVTGAGSAVLLARASEALIPLMTGDARVFFAGLAAAIAGAECRVIVPRGAPNEPTRSLFAHGIVLLAHQLTDGARFMVFAIAVATAAPTPAALGGAAGGAATVLIGAMAGEALLGGWLTRARRAVGLGFLLIGAWLVMQALA